jgi:hypothetical protein
MPEASFCGCPRPPVGHHHRKGHTRKLATTGLLRVRGLSEPERTALGVLTDRPSLPRMHHAPAECAYAFERLCDITHGEVRQREGITWATSASMETKPRIFWARLPALAVRGVSNLQLDPEKLRPEPSRALRVVRGELDQGQGYARHSTSH